MSLPEENLLYEITDNNLIEETEDINNILNDDTYFDDFTDESNFFNEDTITAMQVDYFENYNLKMLHHIANYYSISKKKFKKEKLIQLIVEFENDINNTKIVHKRKKMWNYINKLKNDPYFSKFILFF